MHRNWCELNQGGMACDCPEGEKKTAEDKRYVKSLERKVLKLSVKVAELKKDIELTHERSFKRGYSSGRLR